MWQPTTWDLVLRERMLKIADAVGKAPDGQKFKRLLTYLMTDLKSKITHRRIGL